MIARLIFFVLCASAAICAHAQNNRSYIENIRTVECYVNDDRKIPPVAVLGSDDVVTVAFDDMTHDYVRYVYKLEHCDRDWHVSDNLFESDYMSGTNLDRSIDDYTQSSNTSNLYTHYVLTFPNKYVKPLISGNYKVSIFVEDDTDNPVAEACFSVSESSVGVQVSATSNTDIDYNASSQQVSINLNVGGLELRDPSREISVKVLQNKRNDNAVNNPEPSFVSDREMKWEHCRALIFDGGNEFRKFEILNVKQPTLGVERLRWYDPYYHADLYPGKFFTNYITNEEINGSYVIRNEDDEYNDTRSEYVIVHFTLLSEKEKTGGSFYVCGQWNSYNFLPEYRMRYNSETKAYEADILMKQGYYNYTYLFVPDGEFRGRMDVSEGSFFQTENEYTVYVYGRLQGERYDRLLGYRDFRFIGGK